MRLLNPKECAIICNDCEETLEKIVRALVLPQPLEHYIWLCELGYAISMEYTLRTGKTHKYQDLIEYAEQRLPKEN